MERLNGDELAGTVSLTQAASAVGVSEMTIRRAIQAGRMRAFRAGGSVRIPVESVRAEMERRRPEGRRGIDPRLLEAAGGSGR